MDAEIPSLRLRTPTDVLATMPFMVGYYPSESIVVLGLAGRRLSFAARDDLPRAGAPPGVIGEQVDYLRDVLLRQDCTAAMIIGLGSPERVDRLVAGLIEVYEDAGIRVTEALRAQDGRYWSYLCDSPTCCPPEGVPYDVSGSRVTAEWTYAGAVARRDRAEFEAMIAPVDGAEREALHVATEQAHRRLHSLLLAATDEADAAAALEAAGAEIVDTALTRQFGGERLTDDEVAWLSVLLLDGRVGEIAWWSVSGSVADLEQHQTLWTDVVRRCEPDLVAGPATLLGFAAWRGGNGGLARMALERAIAQEPGLTVAHDLLTALSRGVSPAIWDEIAERVRRRAPRPRRRSSSRRAGSRPA